MMKRTQLYLTQVQHDWLKNTAKTQNTTIARISRKAIDLLIKQHEVSQVHLNQNNVFLEIAKMAKKRGVKGPKDLASNVDKYLYSK